jgi:hypothetical protein
MHGRFLRRWLQTEWSWQRVYCMRHCSQPCYLRIRMHYRFLRRRLQT